jgi:hypothetical protein
VERSVKHPRRGERKPVVANSVLETGIITPSKCLQATFLLVLAAFQEARITSFLGSTWVARPVLFPCKVVGTHGFEPWTSCV